MVTKRDLLTFIDLIPDWAELSHRLERIVLSSSGTSDGEYILYTDDLSTIFLYAWPTDLWMELNVGYFDDHHALLDALGAVYDPPAEDAVMCRFTQAQARAFMLLHVFMHELGHHHDRLRPTTRGTSSGEEYAERFAVERFAEMFPRYIDFFGDPAARQ